MNTKRIETEYKLLEILGDPVRAQIYFEAMIQKEITAKQLMEKLTINRSTLTHHLTKMVEEGIFDVRVQAIGRPIKYYRISESMTKRLIIKKTDKGEDSEQSLRNRIAYLESAIAHLQVITTTTQRLAKELIDELKTIDQKKQVGKLPKLLTFSFSLLSEKEAELLSGRYTKLIKEIQDELREMDSKKDKPSPNYIMFSGLIPTIRSE